MPHRSTSPISEVLREIELGEADFCQAIMADKDEFFTRVQGKQNQRDFSDMKVIIPLKPETKLLITTEMRCSMLKQFKRRYCNNIRGRDLKTFIQSKGPMLISSHIHRLIHMSQAIKDIVEVKFHHEAVVTRLIIDLRNKPQDAEQILADVAIHNGCLIKITKEFRELCHDMKWIELGIDYLEMNLEHASHRLRK